MKSFMFGIILFLAMILVAAPAAVADWAVDEGFEGGSIPASWTVIDYDGDGLQWVAFENAIAHGGSWIAVVEAYSSNDGDDWLITPQVAVNSGDMFEFYARAWYGTEDFEVRVSTTGTDVSDFGDVLDTVTGVGDAWVGYQYDLTPYAGQNCYLAIRWMVDTYALCVDDVRVGQETITPTVDATLGCDPGSGMVPFQTAITVTLTNIYMVYDRQVAGHIDVQLAGGGNFPNWRAGYTNLTPGETYTAFWMQTIPALGGVIGDNVFTLFAEDVTSAPYNQPPYVPSGSTATDTCTVTAIAP